MSEGWCVPAVEAARYPPDGYSMAGVEDVLARAVGRSGEEARAVRESVNGTPSGAFLARAGDLGRAQWFLWVWTVLATGERLGQPSSEGMPGLFLPTSSPRALVIGTVATELYLGYAALRERRRWWPGLVRPEDWELTHRRGAGRLLDTAEALGGTLIKAGQFASTRPDLLPAPFVETLASLQDRVPPRPAPVIEGAIARELGRPVAEVFSEFDATPLAAASIAQVHRARLAEGREVAVKVQYPGVASLIDADLAALETVFKTIMHLEPEIDLQPVADYLRWTLPLELDFRREAKATCELRRALSDRDDVIIPGVVGDLTTERLLVMELAEGVRITDRDALVGAGISPHEVALLLNDAYADQLFRRGVLHADPHPGNLLVQPGPRLVVLDHGLTLALEPSFIATLERMVSAMMRGNLEALTEALGEAGVPVDKDTDLTALLQVVGVLLGGHPGETDFGTFGRRLGASVRDIPPRVLLVGRAIGLLDGITRQLDPEVDALEIVARYT
jgi:predicted unusual protein kinase regulating ubiquinone biosynthesis (AarF/ABC1/UbiB family)